MPNMPYQEHMPANRETNDVTLQLSQCHLLNNLNYQIEVEGAVLDIPDRLQQPARAMQSNSFLANSPLSTLEQVHWGELVPQSN